ncbi:MAG TPA: 4-(cytidine 5'-diphospho)-2-C-methyl-D-erythritol kinase [Methylibium sp.]|uniref:4-(cytidine 5'-diphospho)-2-C-methyl-D-erythritol kinase n=1 Tax=Methylibium sp. TaxID=2067992 RepID=UPI002DB7447F|nr:4-(cytidine 5'-diphospho)-2-C-methyl-D-erythritol kinase [Methylibium sp.]HEU4457910.1 4-(cytidine 5'-diphospho)-2-C-methyl-D-erythritol kinase [Methylibium sp.]
MKALHDLAAPAKLNLFLHVVGRRADGYHELQSVFVLIDWCDTLHLERRADGRLQRHDLGDALPSDDLCLRAARLLQQRAGVADGVDIAIDKRIPSGAGLGGGSSDAATVLLALNRLWKLHWPRGRLAALALELGADVPFFVGGRNAWVEGIGERLTPIELPEPLRGARWAVLKPAQSVPTAAIFGAATLKRDTAAATLPAFLADPTGFGHNDLQPTAEAHSAEVGAALGWLKQRGGRSRMSGSGSAVFAPWTQANDPFEGGVPPGWIARLCRGLECHPLAHWAEDAEPTVGRKTV